MKTVLQYFLELREQEETTPFAMIRKFTSLHISKQQKVS